MSLPEDKEGFTKKQWTWERIGFLKTGLLVSFFRDLEWLLLRRDYFRMSPGHQISVKKGGKFRTSSRIFRMKKVVEEDTGSGKLLFSFTGKFYKVLHYITILG